ncbi:MAG TPA: cation transporter dimerization domain-containing protein, partial [Longimicrobiales bacterium]|nr:cation transporter dimerization domain-containing protein [Longimicrobiales bacterium]
LAVAAVIAHTGWRIIRQTVPVLVDERAVDPTRIQRVAEAHDAVFSCYGIRSRGRSGEVFAELTIALDPELDVSNSHAIADDVEHRVAREVGAREVVVHVEPAG